jgi:hypothetical protein
VRHLLIREGSKRRKAVFLVGFNRKRMVCDEKFELRGWEFELRDKKFGFAVREFGLRDPEFCHIVMGLWLRDPEF